MTHEYTLLLGATILPGGDAPACSALAWASGTILAIGSEAEIRAISRGDSHVMEVPGRFIVPLGALLEIGGSADMAVLDADPRARPGSSAPRRLMVIRGGHMVEAPPTPGADPPSAA
ncbi:MAG TPA: hypothetical protein VES19_00410 [Candidatus Limnocylindrales bacterium]|nr:hypothetical protein [Candidatus Limnocylindrales bacterium]